MRNYVFIFFSLYMLIGCNEKNTISKGIQYQVTISRTSKTIKELQESYEIDSLSYQSMKELCLAFDVLPARKSDLNFIDTLITYHYDFSFAGYIAAKFVQILKNDTSCILTQVYYDNNEEDKEGKSFNIKGYISGKSRQVYAKKYKQITINKNIWNQLVADFKQIKFFDIGRESCDAIVMDGTYSELTFCTQQKLHVVKRHACFHKPFYELCDKIDLLSPNPLHREITY